MVLKLYGSLKSPNVQRVLIVLKEKQIPYELIKVNLFLYETTTPEYLSVQPFGQIPYMMEDDGFTLYESRAIARYIAEKYWDEGTPDLLPCKDLKSRAIFEQAASIELTDFDVYASAIAVEVLIKPYVDNLMAELGEKLDVYNEILGRQRYLAGENITLADLFHIPYGFLLNASGADPLLLNSRPNVKRWFDEISARPSWQAFKDRTHVTRHLAQVM